jgi:bifunctional non-homologous end joining protein LigD
VDKIAVQIDGRTLTLTNLAKVLYPADGFTKAEVLDYYQRISPVLLPHITGRPMTLKRYPDGVDGESFFAKHAPAHRPGWIRTEEVQASSSRARAPGSTISYLVLDDLPALIWAANLAGLELHVPMWRFPPGAGAGNGANEPVPPHGREPDLLVFDLDPGPPATVVECCRVAEALRPLLESGGLRPLAKTSGGKGLQLYAAIGGRTAEQASDEARAFAQRMEAELPGLAVSRMTKTLREGKVLIDWSQNNGSKTTIAPYSLRARVHPTVSTPVTWDEVTACRHPDDLFFTAPDALTRVAEQGDLFAPLLPLAHPRRARRAGPSPAPPAAPPPAPRAGPPPAPRAGPRPAPRPLRRPRPRRTRCAASRPLRRPHPLRCALPAGCRAWRGM